METMMESMVEMMETTALGSDTPAPSTPNEPRRKRKAVAFAPAGDLCQTFTYDGGDAALTAATSPTSRTNARVAATGRRATPYRKRVRSGGSPRSTAREAPGSARRTRNGQRMKRQKRLVESGAVRVKVSQHPNPRRGGGSSRGGGRDGRLVATGAVRMQVTRHTTPRRLNAVGRRIWSPPPPSSAERRRPRSEIVHRIRRAEYGGRTTPPSGGRRNGLTGGHRFRAAMSPPPKSAAVANLSRTLF